MKEGRKMQEILQVGLLKLLPNTIVYMLLGYLVVKALDFILGLLKTWKNGNYKSSKMRDGIIRWIAELIGIVFVMLLDFVLGLNFYITGFTSALFLYKETGSILENLAECGVNMPKVLKDKLEVLNLEKDKE